MEIHFCLLLINSKTMVPRLADELKIVHSVLEKKRNIKVNVKVLKFRGSFLEYFLTIVANWRIEH